MSSVSGRLKKTAEEKDKLLMSTPVGVGGRRLRHLISNPRVYPRGSPTLSFQSGVSGMSGGGGGGGKSASSVTNSKNGNTSNKEVVVAEGGGGGEGDGDDGVVNAFIYGEEMDLKIQKKHGSNKRTPSTGKRSAKKNTSDQPLLETMKEIRASQTKTKKKPEKTLLETVQEIAKRKTPVKQDKLKKADVKKSPETKPAAKPVKRSVSRKPKSQRDGKDKSLIEAIKEIQCSQAKEGVKKSPEVKPAAKPVKRSVSRKSKSQRDGKDKSLIEAIKEIQMSQSSQAKGVAVVKKGKRKAVESVGTASVAKKAKTDKGAKAVGEEVSKIVKSATDEYVKSAAYLHQSGLSSFINDGVQELLKARPMPENPALWLGRWLTKHHAKEPEGPKLMDVIMSLSQGR